MEIMYTAQDLDNHHILTKYYFIQKIELGWDGLYDLKITFLPSFNIPVYVNRFSPEKRGFFAQVFGQQLPAYIADVLGSMSPENLYYFISKSQGSPYFEANQVIYSNQAMFASLRVYLSGKDYWINWNKTPVHHIHAGQCDGRSNPEILESLRHAINTEIADIKDLHVSLHPNGSTHMQERSFSLVKEGIQWRRTTAKNNLIHQLQWENSGVVCPPKDYVGKKKFMKPPDNDEVYLRRCLDVQKMYSLWQQDTYVEKKRSHTDVYYHPIRSEVYICCWDPIKKVETRKSHVSAPHKTNSLQQPPLEIVHPSQIQYLYSDIEDAVYTKNDSIVFTNAETYRLPNGATIYCFCIHNTTTNEESEEHYAIVASDIVYILSGDDPHVKQVLNLRMLKDALMI